MELFENYPRYERLLATAQLALAMLGMGAVLAPRDFGAVLRAPRGFGVGLGVQLVLVPLVAFALGRVLPLPAGVAVGLVLVASVPGGTLSNLVTFLGGGHLPLSISLTGVTTVAALLSTPLLMQLLVGAHLPPEFAMPTARVAREIAVTLLLPLFAGMALGARLGPRREAFSRACIRLSLLAIGLMVLGAGGSGRLDPRSYGWLGAASVLLLALGLQAAAWLSCRAARLRGSERLAVVTEATVRNVNLALLVKTSLFPAVAGRPDPLGDGVLFVTLLYGGVSFLAVAPAALHHRRRGQPWRGADPPGGASGDAPSGPPAAGC